MIRPIPGNPILESIELTWPWVGLDPFLVCAHHVEHYPAGNPAFGVPEDRLKGHDNGHDFGNPDGFNLYFGAQGLPGFPNHPHCGMETVSILRKGVVDHADSLGNSGRYAAGDVQWMTAGAGLQHSEMFPLLHQDEPNEFELFQIWLNMPASSKKVQPEYKMLWAEQIPHYRNDGADVSVIAGDYLPQELPGASLIKALQPTDSTWAARADAEFAIWMVDLQPGGSVTLPAAQLSKTQRTLFAYSTPRLLIAGQDVGDKRRVQVVAQQALALANPGSQPASLMVMQGVAIEEPTIRSNVYVTNTLAELHQAKRDFQRTGFGGWPWPTRQPMHGGAEVRRFARYAGVDIVESP